MWRRRFNRGFNTLNLFVTPCFCACKGIRCLCGIWKTPETSVHVRLWCLARACGLLLWRFVTHLSIWGHSHLWTPVVPDRFTLKAYSSFVSLTSMCGLFACYSVVWIKMMSSQSEAPARCPFFHPVCLHAVMLDALRLDAVALSLFRLQVRSDWELIKLALTLTIETLGLQGFA